MPSGLENLFVRKNEPVSAARWNALVRAVAARRIVKSRDCMPFESPHGTTLNLRRLGQPSHPWQVIEGANLVVITPGTVNNIEPTIGETKRKITELPPVPLDLGSGGFDEAGKGWIAIEVQYDKGFTAVKMAKMVHVANLGGTSQAAIVNPSFYIGIPGLPKQRARYPIARVIRRGTQFEVHQIAYFNLQTKARTVGDLAKNIPRHFWWPA